MRFSFACLISLITAFSSSAKEKEKKKTTSPLDEYVMSVEHRTSTANHEASLGSIYSSGGSLANAARDLRASQVDDLITILVADRATALSKGVTNSSRKSSAKYGVTAAAGPLKATGALPNLLGANGDRALQGQGETSRENNITTTLSARVTHVLPSGNLVVEGVKSVTVNSENQLVTVRGIIRPADISAANLVRSDRLSDLEIRINGQGVVGDAVKRPFILYRLLMGLLPF
jgi:flagellar L-ring protein precursor FlgH